MSAYCVHFAQQQFGSAFQYSYFQFFFTQFPSSFQTQHTTADNDRMFCLECQMVDLFYVSNGTNWCYAFQICALDRRHEAVRAQCIYLSLIHI